MNRKEKIILAISWSCLIILTIYSIWAFATYGIDPNHVYFHL